VAKLAQNNKGKMRLTRIPLIRSSHGNAQGIKGGVYPLLSAPAPVFQPEMKLAGNNQYLAVTTGALPLPLPMGAFPLPTEATGGGGAGRAISAAIDRPPLTMAKPVGPITKRLVSITIRAKSEKQARAKDRFMGLAS